MKLLKIKNAIESNLKSGFSELQDISINDYSFYGAVQSGNGLKHNLSGVLLNISSGHLPVVLDYEEIFNYKIVNEDLIAFTAKKVMNYIYLINQFLCFPHNESYYKESIQDIELDVATSNKSIYMYNYGGTAYQWKFLIDSENHLEPIFYINHSVKNVMYEIYIMESNIYLYCKYVDSNYYKIAREYEIQITDSALFEYAIRLHCYSYNVEPLLMVPFTDFTDEHLKLLKIFSC